MLKLEASSGYSHMAFRMRRKGLSLQELLRVTQPIAIPCIARLKGTERHRKASDQPGSMEGSSSQKPIRGTAESLATKRKCRDKDNDMPWPVMVQKDQPGVWK